MKQITRTVTSTNIYASTVSFEKGTVVTTDLCCITVDNAKLDDKKALKVVQKKHGKDNQYVIRSIEYSEVTYGIDFDTFMKYATPIEKASDEAAATQE